MARGDLDPDLPSLRSVGYRQLWSHLAGACGLPDAVAAGQRATRNLAEAPAHLAAIGTVLDWNPQPEDQELVPILRVMSTVAAR